MIAEKLHPAQDALKAAFEALPVSSVRTKAFASFAKTGLPHRRMEAWKWTDLQAALAKDLPVSEERAARLSVPENAMYFHIVNGQLKRTPDLPEGVKLTLCDTPEKPGTLPMTGLASALSPLSITLHIDGKLDAPLFFCFEGQGHTSLTLSMAANAQAQIIEDHGVSGGFANTALRYDLGKNARLTRLVYQHSDASAVHVVCAEVSLPQFSQLDQFSVNFGARLARLETHVSYTGKHARARLNGAYLLDGERHGDQTFHVDHAKESCTTRQLLRGVVKDSARGVFQGKFYVARDGQHTDAAMNHDAILLNPGASVNAKPELEIYADDVACAHGNTSGALDENALFYMRQRGLDEARAKALLTYAFLGTSFDDLKDETLHDMLMAPIKLWLEQAL